MSSENGWEPAQASPDQCEWVTVPGTNVSLQLLKGWPSIIMRAYAADYNAFVEPLRDADSAGWTPTNSVATSNHLNGTAMDLNWDSHPFRVADAGYSPQMIDTMRELLDFYEKTIWWANDWDEPKDAMHHQMGYDTFNNPHTGDFIARKIRVDGFSTFRRGGTPSPPPMSKADGYALDIIAEGRRRNITERGIKIALSVALVESNLQMYANSNVPESMNLPHDAVGTDHDSVGLFQQRCPMWGPAEVLMNPALSAGLFYDRLAAMNYNDPNRSPGSFAADVQRPAAQYRGRYDERFGEAEQLYNRLAGVTPPPISPPGEDELSAEAERMIRELYDEYTARRRMPTRSIFAMDMGPVETPLGFEDNIDANVWDMKLTWGYLFGVRRAVEYVERVARDGVSPQSWAGQLTDAEGHWLAEFGQQYCWGLIAFRTALQNAMRGTLPEPSAAPIPLPVVYQPPVAPAPVAEPIAATNGTPKSTGDVIGALYSALEDMHLADALPIEARAPLAALISVLQTKNGSQLQ